MAWPVVGGPGPRSLLCWQVPWNQRSSRKSPRVQAGLGPTSRQSPSSHLWLCGLAACDLAEWKSQRQPGKVRRTLVLAIEGTGLSLGSVYSWLCGVVERAGFGGRFCVRLGFHSTPFAQVGTPLTSPRPSPECLHWATLLPVQPIWSRLLSLSWCTSRSLLVSPKDSCGWHASLALQSSVGTMQLSCD